MRLFCVNTCEQVGHVSYVTAPDEQRLSCYLGLPFELLPQRLQQALLAVALASTVPPERYDEVFHFLGTSRMIECCLLFREMPVFERPLEWNLLVELLDDLLPSIEDEL